MISVETEQELEYYGSKNVIYLLLNEACLGRCYIGMSKADSGRLKQQFYLFDSCIVNEKFKDDIAKNGKKSFKLFILCVLPYSKIGNLNLLSKAENYFIIKYNSHKQGYNSPDISYPLTEEEKTYFDENLKTITENSIIQYEFKELLNKCFEKIQNIHINLNDVCKNNEKNIINYIHCYQLIKQNLIKISKDEKERMLKNIKDIKVEFIKNISEYINRLNITEFWVQLYSINDSKQYQIIVNEGYIKIKVNCTLQLDKTRNYIQTDNTKVIELKIYI